MITGPSEPPKIGDVATFTCEATVHGNPTSYTYDWSNVSEHPWECTTNRNAFICTVTNDCENTVTCRVRNDAGLGGKDEYALSPNGKSDFE